MKRVVVAVAAAALITLGGAGAAGATALLDEQTPAQWACPGFGAWSGGTYNPANNPTFQKLAEKLGTTTDALASDLKAGKSLADIAKSKNIDLNSLVDIMDAPMDEMMKVMVDNGFMTKEQADAMDQWREAREKAGLEQNGYFGGAMGPGMMGGFGRGGMMGPRFAPGTGTQTPGAVPGYGPGMRGFGGMMGGWQNRSN